MYKICRAIMIIKERKILLWHCFKSSYRSLQYDSDIDIHAKFGSKQQIQDYKKISYWIIYQMIIITLNCCIALQQGDVDRDHCLYPVSSLCADQCTLLCYILPLTVVKYSNELPNLNSWNLVFLNSNCIDYIVSTYALG